MSHYIMIQSCHTSGIVSAFLQTAFTTATRTGGKKRKQKNTERKYVNCENVRKTRDPTLSKYDLCALMQVDFFLFLIRKIGLTNLHHCKRNVNQFTTKVLKYAHRLR